MVMVVRCFECNSPCYKNYPPSSLISELNFYPVLRAIWQLSKEPFLGSHIPLTQWCSKWHIRNHQGDWIPWTSFSTYWISQNLSEWGYHVYITRSLIHFSTLDLVPFPSGQKSISSLIISPIWQAHEPEPSVLLSVLLVSLFCRCGNEDSAISELPKIK